MGIAAGARVQTLEVAELLEGGHLVADGGALDTPSPALLGDRLGPHRNRRSARTSSTTARSTARTRADPGRHGGRGAGSAMRAMLLALGHGVLTAARCGPVNLCDALRVNAVTKGGTDLLARPTSGGSGHGLVR